MVEIVLKYMYEGIEWKGSNCRPTLKVSFMVAAVQLQAVMMMRRYWYVVNGLRNSKQNCGLFWLPWIREGSWRWTTNVNLKKVCQKDLDLVE